MTAIKTSQIKSQLSGILKKYPEANIIGLKTACQWRLESVLRVNEQAFWIKIQFAACYPGSGFKS
ncbi:hypothetical protein QUF90_02090 [Desulfococcaceae bacterium HSG9]|nr:hypothetical protein [Desulfococcaceae bacterium HSG9]